MKSFMAALRSLALPFGKTTGTRINLDGVIGFVGVYNADNKLIGVIAASAGKDATGTQYPAGMSVIPPGPFLGTGQSAITLDPIAGQIRFFGGPGQSAYTEDGTIYAGNPNGYDGTGAYYSILTPGTGNGQLHLWARSPSRDGYEGYYFSVAPYDAGNAARYNATEIGFAGVVYAKSSDGTFVTTEHWQTLPLANGWVADGTPAVYPPQFRRGPDGLISLRGWAKNGAAGLVGTLPDRYRPGQRLIGWMAQPGSTTASNRYIIEPGGQINVDGNVSGSVSLSVPPFHAADVK